MNAARIIAETERYHRLAPGSIRRRIRHRYVSWPRQMAMFLIRTELGWSYPKIARAVGLKDHTTAMYGCRRFAERALESIDMFMSMADVRERVRG